MRRLTLTILTLMFLTSCSSVTPIQPTSSCMTPHEIARPGSPTGTSSTFRYKVMTPPVLTELLFKVEWMTPAAVEARCGKGAQGCYIRNVAQENYIIIFAVQPADFNDEYRLLILGHEVFHGLGATHD